MARLDAIRNIEVVRSTGQFPKALGAKSTLIEWKCASTSVLVLSEAVLVIAIGRNSFLAFEYAHEQEHEMHRVLI